MNQERPISQANFREFLDRELAHRNSLNPNYSLRAFARDLGVDSSFLSKLLNGKRSMTARTIMTLAPRLSLVDDQLQAFLRGANGRRRRFSMGGENKPEIFPLNEICDDLNSSHLALLAMFEMKDFMPELRLVAPQLETTEENVEGLLKDLEAMKLITKDESGRWSKHAKNYSLNSRQHPRAKSIKKSIWDQATARMMEPEELGLHSAMTFSVSESCIAEANARIKKFSLDLAELMSHETAKDNVYHLAISLFPAIKK